ncbi:MAG: hypothetical protein KME64_24210 [Scytonematopsis contorta HA4267-MV1]|jgi:hypothetical protein|nr:hypothetical protein [Scytonematopsis contorta HA4267-MV1]
MVHKIIYKNNNKDQIFCNINSHIKTSFKLKLWFNKRNFTTLQLGLTVNSTIPGEIAQGLTRLLLESPEKFSNPN